MDGELNVLLKRKDRIESRIHDYMVKIKKETVELNQNELKIQEYQDMHCYFRWKKQIMFHFNILSYFCNYLFSCSIQIPIDIIRYILLLSLRYEQSLLTSDFIPPCVNRECIIKWWKLSIPNHVAKPFEYKLLPFHCNNCHTCFDDKEKSFTRYLICSRCSKWFCFYCDKDSTGKRFKNYELLCKSWIMDDFNRIWPNVTTIEMDNRYKTFIAIDEPIKFKEYKKRVFL